MAAPRPGLRRLCPLSALDGGGPTGFPPPPGGLAGLVAQRPDGTVRVWRNACPHLGLPLDRVPGQFSFSDGVLACAMHGARFDTRTGACLSGPCPGTSLEPVAAVVEDGWLLVPDDAGL